MADWGNFFCWHENDKNYIVRDKFIWFDLLIELYKKIKRFPVPERPNGMDSASAIASPSSLLTPTGRTKHDL